MLKESVYILLIALITGCSSDHVFDSPQENSIPLSLASVSKSFSSEKVAMSLPQGLSTGVYVAGHDADIGTSYYKNQKYVSQSFGGLSSSSITYLTLGASFDIYSYCPYQDGDISPKSIVFPHGTDVLCASKNVLQNVSESSNHATLNYAHVSSQVSFNVVLDEGYSGALLKFTDASSIIVSGFFAEGSLDASTGTYVGTGTGSVQMIASGTKDGVSTMTIPPICVVPAANMNLQITVNHEGKVYKGVINDAFAPGNSYRYTVTVRSELGLGVSGTLTDWNNTSGDVQAW